MAKTKISEFSATPANNTDIDSINLAEGCAPSGINDAIRELMAQLKDFQTGAAGDSFNGPVGTTTAAAGAFTNLTASGTLGVTGATTLSSALTYGGVTLSNAVTGTGSMVLSNSPTLVTPALGTPASGVVTNLTGTASININGTVGATTATTGAFTTLAASGAVTLSGGTANGVAYLNGSKVLTSGSALTFDGTVLKNSGTTNSELVLDTSATPVLTMIGGTGTIPLIGFKGNGLRFGTVTGTGGVGFSELMQLTSTGLGIGTSSPQRKLHVNATPGATYGDVARFESNGSAGPVTLSFGDSGTTSALPTIGGNGNSLVFGTGAATKATIDLSGNLGLGVTPNTWSAYKVMQISGVSGVYANGSNEMGMFQNAYYNSGWKYGATGVAAAWAYQYQGGHYWQIAPSGTAGNAISFTQAATLTANGEYLVGLTSATGVAKLQVSGALRTTGFTVSTLPAGTVGMRTYVTDALAPSFSATVVGGGAVTIPVFYNGSNWIVA